jgi:hypothetical protein
MFSNSKDFVTKYGKMLQDKAKKVKDFTYNGYPYDLAAGEAQAKSDRDAIDKAIEDKLKLYDIGLESLSTKEFNEKISAKLDGKFDKESKPSASEVIDDFLSTTLKASDVSEYTSDLYEKFQGGSTKKEDIKNFEGNSIDKMISFLKDSSDKISKCQNQLSKYEEKVKKVISKLDKYTSKDGVEGGENMVSEASYVSSLISAYLNLYKAPCNVEISIYKRVASEWLGVLKKFYNYKGNKGAFESTGEDMIDPEALGTIESDTPDDIIDDSAATDDGAAATDDGGKGGSDNDKKGDSAEECATESAIASILETANAYRF